MIAQGSIDLYVVGGEIDSSVDFSRLIFAISIDELPDTYGNGQILLLSFDFAPLEAWKLYKAVANQSTAFNASEWMEDTINPYVKAVEAADRDGALAEALADGTITITPSITAPVNPSLYDIWQCPAANVNIGELSAADAEIMQKNGTNDVYFYWGTDSQWHLTTMPMESSIQDSKSTAVVKSQASVWNKVNVGGIPYINGWQSIIEYENNHLLKNDFAIIADNFYIGAVGNVVQNGIDSAGNPIYESTGEAYKPFSVDIVNHKIKFDGIVDFTNTNSFGTTTIDGGKITTGSIWAQGKISGNGFMLNGQASGTSSDPTIYGAYIKGGTVEGTVIRGATLVGAFISASYIDFSQAKTLTLWAYYGDSPHPSPPTAYLQNFAKDDLGVLIVDGSGYNRLVRSGATATAGFNYTMPVHAYAWSADIPTHTTTLNGYGSYNTSSTLRCLSNGTTVTVSDYNAPLVYLEYEYWTGMRGRITVVKDGVSDSIWFTYLYENSAGASNTKQIFRNGSVIAEQTVGHRTDMTFSVNGLSFSYKYADDITIFYPGLYFNPSPVTFTTDMIITYSEFATMHTNDGAGWSALMITIPIMTAQ